MHPFLVQRRWLLLYLLFFLQAGLFLSEILVGTRTDLRFRLWLLVLPLFLVHAFSCLASWYLCRALPLGKARLEHIVVTQAASALLAGAALTTAGSFGARFLDEQIGDVYGQGRLLVWAFAVFLYSLMVVLHYLFAAVEASRKAEAVALESQILAREAELQSLRAQIDPHFLFNSLSSVSALVSSDPEQARRMCALLARFFRRTLDLGGRRSVTLEEETALVEDYLGIEKVRFEERLSPEIEIDPALHAYRLPPLILQPLAENAVRHGIGHLLEGGRVRVTATSGPGGPVIRVENPCDPDRPRSPRKGVGLENVRRRLETTYGSRASLEAQEADERFRVTIRLPAPRRTEERPKPEETP